MPAEDHDAHERALRKRGFKRDDPHYYECATCGERAVVRFGLQGRLGGRDLELCAACGKVRSWTRRGGVEDRVEDVDFDLVTFLR